MPKIDKNTPKIDKITPKIDKSTPKIDKITSKIDKKYCIWPQKIIMDQLGPQRPN